MSDSSPKKNRESSPQPSTSYSPCSKVASKSKKGGLVPYFNDSTGSSSDEADNREIKETRRKSISSPRKRKRVHLRCLSSKVFTSLKEEDQFQDVFPTVADGSIDINRLFDPTDTGWQENLNKTLYQFISAPGSNNLVKEDKVIKEAKELSETEYEVDLGTLELVPALIKQRKRLSELSDEEERDGTNLGIQNEAAGRTILAEASTQNSVVESEDDTKFTKPKLKPKCRKFIFKPFLRQPDGTLVHDEQKAPVDIIIPEQLAASYGLYIWPCSPVLAWYIWLHQNDFQGKNVLELGSGTALPGLLCAKIGARKVWLSDDAWQPNTLKNGHEAVKINSLEEYVDVIGLTWGEYNENLIQFRNNQLDYIIGSDLFFDPKVFEPLIKTISYLLTSNKEAEVFITVQERSSDWSIQDYLRRWKLCCDYIFPREFLRGTGIDESDLIGGHTIFILRIFNQTT